MNAVFKRHKSALVLLAILAFALSLRLQYFVGPGLNDDVDYFYSARAVSRGDFGSLYGGSINAIRSMVTAPIAFFFRLFGRTDKFVAEIWPLLCSLGTVVLTYFLGKGLFSQRTGLLAAFVLSFFPVDVAFSTQIVPTTQVVFFFTLTLFLLFRSLTKKRAPGKFLFLAGISGGLGYLANIMMVFVLFFSVGLFLLMYCRGFRRLLRAAIPIIVGFLLVFLVEACFMFAFTGNPLHRLQVIHETEKMIGTNTAMEYYPKVMGTITNPDYSAHQGNLGLHFFAFVAGAAFLTAFRRRKGAIFLALTFLLIMSYFQFGIMTSTLKPIAKWVRYLIIFGPIFSISIAEFFRSLLPWEKLTAPLAALVLLFATIPYLEGTTRAYNEQLEPFRETAEYLDSLETDSPVYADGTAAAFFSIELGFGRMIRVFDKKTEPENVAGSYVVLNGSRGTSENQEMRGYLPEFARNPPGNFRLVRKIEGKFFSPEIYYAEKT
ncbi:MAG: glycosyltransferase family 39 protein [archaeon]